MKEKQFKLFGFTVFKRNIHSYDIMNEMKTIDVNSYQGLCFLGEDLSIEFQSPMIFEKYNWNKLAVNSILFGLYILYSNQAISILKYEIEEKYFGEIYTNKSHYYDIVPKTVKLNDPVLNLILKAAKYKKPETYFSFPVSRFLEYILNDTIGKNTIPKPEKEFIKNLVCQYAHSNSNLKITEKSKAFGLHSTIGLTMNEILKKEISRDYAELVKIQTTIITNEYRQFQDLLMREIKTIFSYRTEIVDNDSSE